MSLLLLTFFYIPLLLLPGIHNLQLCTPVEMATGKIIGGVAASFAIAYVCDVVISDKKIFGGQLDRTMCRVILRSARPRLSLHLFKTRYNSKNCI